MRKFLLTITLVGALVALGGVTFALAAPGKSADVYGVGGGKTDLGTVKFDLSAHTTGVRDFGHVGVTETMGSSQVSYYIDVDCVSVFGSLSDGFAAITGVVRRVTPVPNMFDVAVGDRFVVTAHDGGNPSSAPVDGFLARETDSTFDCKNDPVRIPFANVTQGNITIKTA
jgi:hypothetical protein